MGWDRAWEKGSVGGAAMHNLPSHKGQGGRWDFTVLGSPLNSMRKEGD